MVRIEDWDRLIHIIIMFLQRQSSCYGYKWMVLLNKSIWPHNTWIRVSPSKTFVCQTAHHKHSSLTPASIVGWLHPDFIFLCVLPMSFLVWCKIPTLYCVHNACTCSMEPRPPSPPKRSPNWSSQHNINRHCLTQKCWQRNLMQHFLVMNTFLNEI